MEELIELYCVTYRGKRTFTRNDWEAKEMVKGKPSATIHQMYFDPCEEQIEEFLTDLCNDKNYGDLLTEEDIAEIYPYDEDEDGDEDKEEDEYEDGEA